MFVVRSAGDAFMSTLSRQADAVGGGGRTAFPAAGSAVDHLSRALFTMPMRSLMSMRSGKWNLRKSRAVRKLTLGLGGVHGNTDEVEVDVPDVLPIARQPG